MIQHATDLVTFTGYCAGVLCRLGIVVDFCGQGYLLNRSSDVHCCLASGKRVPW
jgi:hypothetical protein